MHHEDEDVPPSEEEKELAKSLRDALETSENANHDADFLRAVSLAHQPKEIDSQAHDAILDRALAETPRAKRNNVRRISFGVMTAFAIAASVILFFSSAKRPPGPTLVAVRSTQSLFDQKFDNAKSSSARIDRIAIARESDLRENRFTRWGIR